MKLEPGRMLLHYRLVERIGEGGMGVVWKAVDSTLGREVAIKVLPEHLAGDADRLARFEREARLLAALNHPGIATVHGLHEVEGTRFLAMELAAGEDLARRLSRGPVSPTEALSIGVQLADAIEAAHEQGVVHRDLKPANIQLGPDGRIKVLDFGLAKALEPDPTRGPSPSMSPTLTSAGTLAGVILGTAAYMSPEQAKGDPVDKRTDIWSFGCVMLEMLGGRRPFPGRSVVELLAAVIRGEPDWSGLAPDTPPRLRRLIERCLVKDPRGRLRDIGDARIILSEVIAGDTEALDAPPPVASWKRWLPWAVSAMLALVLLVALTRIGGPSGQPASGPAAGAHLSVIVPETEPVYLVNSDLEMMTALALSSSGDRLVYTALEPPEATRGSGARALQTRRLDSFASERLRGAEEAEMPFFSPDGRWIGYFDGEALRKIPVAGGASVLIAAGIGNGNGADWGRDGTIVFAHSYVGGLWRVSDAGGTPVPVTTLAEGERSHRYPHLLPDGKSVIFTVKPSGILSFDEGRIAIADLATGAHRVLLDGGTDGRYVASGHVVYGRETGLLAAPFDAESLRITGGAVPVLDGVVVNPVTGSAQFTVSANGALAYVPGDYRKGPTSLVEIDPASGTRRAMAEGSFAVVPRLSPDGRRLVMHGSAANDSVLMLDIERNTVTRVTDPATNSVLPIWGPDGKRIYFSSDRSGEEELVSMPADGGAMETVVPARGVPVDASDWSADGRLLALGVGVRTARDIWVLDTRGTGEPEPFLATPFNERDAVFRPDGRWIAYSSDESGTQEVYVAPYPGPGGKIQISTGGGCLPRWRGDGAELYYQAGSQIVAVTVPSGPVLRPGRPRALFDLTSNSPTGYDVSKDGKRFYVVLLDESRWKSQRVDVVLGWFEELQRLAK